MLSKPEGSLPLKRNPDGISGEMDAEHEIDADHRGNPSKKKKKPSKNSDKKYECPQDGCGKSYSRAEHLYRHQLNRGYLA